MTIPSVWTSEETPGGSYVTGGFVVVTGLSSIQSFQCNIKTLGAGVGNASFDISWSGPNATIKLLQRDYDKLSIISTLTNLPSGITERLTSGGTHDTSTHIHDMNHNHPATPASGAPSGFTAATLAAPAQPAVTTHTHTMDLPNFVANVVAETAHVHTWNSIYQHQHALTNTTTDLALVELANGSAFTGTVFQYVAVGTA